MRENKSRRAPRVNDASRAGVLKHPLSPGTAPVHAAWFDPGHQNAGPDQESISTKFSSRGPQFVGDCKVEVFVRQSTFRLDDLDARKRGAVCECSIASSSWS